MTTRETLLDILNVCLDRCPEVIAELHAQNPEGVTIRLRNLKTEAPVIEFTLVAERDPRTNYVHCRFAVRTAKHQMA